ELNLIPDLHQNPVFQGPEADLEDPDLRGDQRQRSADPGVDRADCDAGVEIPAIEIDVLLVAVDSGSPVTATVVPLPGSVGLAGRSVSGPAGTGGGTRRRAAACDLVVGSAWTAENLQNRLRLISGDL